MIRINHTRLACPVCLIWVKSLFLVSNSSLHILHFISNYFSGSSFFLLYFCLLLSFLLSYSSSSSSLSSFPLFLSTYTFTVGICFSPCSLVSSLSATLDSSVLLLLDSSLGSYSTTTFLLIGFSFSFFFFYSTFLTGGSSSESDS